MMEREYQKAREAYNKYAINNEVGIAEKILEYVIKRIAANKEEIDKILKLNNREITYKDVEKVAEEEIKRI